MKLPPPQFDHRGEVRPRGKVGSKGKAGPKGYSWTLIIANTLEIAKDPCNFKHVLGIVAVYLIVPMCMCIYYVLEKVSTFTMWQLCIKHTSKVQTTLCRNLQCTCRMKNTPRIIGAQLYFHHLRLSKRCM
jgi:hypothetical protein